MKKMMKGMKVPNPNEFNVIAQLVATATMEVTPAESTENEETK